MASVDTEAVVLRGIRYGEADVVLTLFTRARGRVSALAKGARRPASRLGGRLQPGVTVMAALHRGRGDMYTVRGASVVDARAGLWMAGGRLQAAGCVLEAVMRVLPEDEENAEGWHLLQRALGLIAAAEPADVPARLHPLVLGTQAKLLVVSGLLPVLDRCARCGDAGPPAAFSAAAGGVLCAACARTGEPVEPAAVRALAGLVGSPLAGAAGALPAASAAGVERLIGLVLHEHLGVRLRSASPL